MDWNWLSRNGLWRWRIILIVTGLAFELEAVLTTVTAGSCVTGVMSRGGSVIADAAVE